MLKVYFDLRLWDSVELASRIDCWPPEWESVLVDLVYCSQDVILQNQVTIIEMLEFLCCQKLMLILSLFTGKNGRIAAVQRRHCSAKRKEEERSSLHCSVRWYLFRWEDSYEQGCSQQPESAPGWCDQVRICLLILACPGLPKWSVWWLWADWVGNRVRVCRKFSYIFQTRSQKCLQDHRITE